MAGYDVPKAGSDIFGSPTKLQKTVDGYFAYVDAQPVQHVQVGKNIYERTVPHTVEGLCAYIGVQKSDVKTLLTDPAANAKCRDIMVTAITRIEALLTEKALLGQLDATVAKIVLSGSLLNSADAEIDAQNGFTIRIHGMSQKDADEASR